MALLQALGTTAPMGEAAAARKPRNHPARISRRHGRAGLSPADRVTIIRALRSGRITVKVTRAPEGRLPTGKVPGGRTCEDDLEFDLAPVLCAYWKDG
jgi:hypothetical protein